MSKELSSIIESASNECLIMMEVKWADITLLNKDKQVINSEIDKLEVKLRKINAEKRKLNTQISEINEQIKQINKEVVYEIEKTANRNGLKHTTLKKILHHDNRFDIPIYKNLIPELSNTI